MKKAFLVQVKIESLNFSVLSFQFLILFTVSWRNMRKKQPVLSINF